MIERITYLISSSIGYDEPLRVLLATMAHIPDDRKRVSVGQSWDYTALIDALDDMPAGHVFLLHDTMELDPDSERLISQADPDMEVTAAYPGCQCNLGLYRSDYLLSQADYIRGLRDCTKLRAIQEEGGLWRRAKKRAVYPGAECIRAGVSRPYGGAERLKEIYTAVGITKHKANHGQTMDPRHFEVRP